MNTKLTLTIEQEVIVKAKKFAKQKGRSLSDLVENYFKTITLNDLPNIENNGSISSSLLGCVEEPKNFEYKKEIEEIRTNKYLKNG